MCNLYKTASLAAVMAAIVPSLYGQQFSTDSLVFKYFEKVLFYDVYAGTVSEDVAPVPEGLTRLNNSRYARPIPNADLAQMGDTIRLDVVLNPACDNYDRIANVSLALLPKGTTHYNDADNNYLGRLGSTDPSIRRIEIGRFITPFMDKNKAVQDVPYTWDVSYLAPMFHDQALLDTADIWIELTIEGVPYAANTQISGCSGRNDVFYGSAQFVTNRPLTPLAQNGNSRVVPFTYQRYLNSYNETHTDESGTLTAHYTLHLDEDLEDALFVFINSNHGANSGGEEYSRRIHYVFINEWMAMVYRPGRQSCEPFRQYNTQANGIYGGSVMSDASWQSFSNWCPGDKIDNRIIHLGAIEKGDYDFRMLVPDARFANNEGYFPFSLTFFGLKQGSFNGLEMIKESGHQGSMQLTWDNDMLMLAGENIENIVHWKLLNMQGQCLLSQPAAPIQINMNHHASGVYILLVEMNDGRIETYKFFNK